MADDIVTRLRTAPPSVLGVRLQAADLIEAQQAEIERLRAEMDRLALRSCATCKLGIDGRDGYVDCTWLDTAFKADHYCAYWNAGRD